VVRLVPGQVKHGRGVLADPDLDRASQSFVVVHVAAQRGQVQIKSYALLLVLICRARTESRMQVLWAKGAEQHGSGAIRVRDHGSLVNRAGRERVDEILWTKGRKVSEQDRGGAGRAQTHLDVVDPLANGGVEALAVVSYDGATLIAYEGRSEPVGGHDDQLGRPHRGEYRSDRVQGKGMRQIGPRHPVGWMQTALGGQPALDRDDQSPAVDVGGVHLDDRVSPGALVSTPTLFCGEDDGEPGPDWGKMAINSRKSGASVRRTRPDRRLPRSYRALAMIIRPVMMLMTRRDWIGAENFPSRGGFVVCPNHISYVDVFAFAHFLYDNGHPPFFLAKTEVFKIPVIGRLLTAAQQIEVKRGTSHAAEAFSYAVEALNEGKCVPIFPEGTLTRDPAMWPMTAKTGAARVALTTRCPVIPVAQWGPQEILAPYAKEPHLFPRKTMRMIAGPPVDLSDLYDRPVSAAILREATDRILDAITRQLETLRGEPAPAIRFDSRTAGIAPMGNPNRPHRTTSATDEEPS
jgi:1-acyl-sn-glycerol-3-phosphate acyltransferase